MKEKDAIEEKKTKKPRIAGVSLIKLLEKSFSLGDVNSMLID